MDDNVTNVTNYNPNSVPPDNPYKEMQFEKFLEILEDTPVNNWTVLAQGLGVDRLTILRWRRHPRAQKLLKDALQDVLDNMKKAGTNDWRMWREYAKLLGIDDIQKFEATIDVKDALDELDKVEKTDYAKFGSKAKEQMVENDPPIQNQEQGGGTSDVPTQFDAAPTFS